MSKRRVLFYVQHLLGIGHLRRAATLTRALQRAGFETTLVSGGHAIPGLDVGAAELVQLPPTRAADMFFKLLLDEHDNPVDDAWRGRRRDHLLRVWRERQPQVLMTELFPFGRRQMRFELLPLLDAATAAVRRPLIISSVRDILVAQDKPEREKEMVDLVLHYFDHVLVHGDPALIPLDQTFPLVQAIGDRLHYTGYVVDESGTVPAADGAGQGEVIVSAGGGAVGEQLLATAIQARALTPLAAVPWRVLVGVSVDTATFDRLRQSAPSGVEVERARPDFASLLQGCRLSISQGGYNTVMEVLQAGCRGVVVPYAGGVETEQTLRAALLADRGGLHVLAENALTPAALAAAVAKALAAPPAGPGGIDMDGAEASAQIVGRLAEAMPW
jgi:predicted glycosyltransferase